MTPRIENNENKSQSPRLLLEIVAAHEYLPDCLVMLKLPAHARASQTLSLWPSSLEAQRHESPRPLA